MRFYKFPVILLVGLVLLATIGSALAASIVLVDNGPVFNIVVAGNPSYSRLDSTLSMSILGAGCSKAGGLRLADDFTVPAGATYHLGSVKFFTYQTGSGNTSTITEVNLKIWNGIPGDAASAVVWGDETTNRLAATKWTGGYRDLTSAPNNTTRPIMEAIANVDTDLTAGSYWLDWQIAGSGGSGPWCPPITITGQAATGNSRQYNSPAWVDFADNTFPQGMPFVIDQNAVSRAALISSVNPAPYGGSVTFTATLTAIQASMPGGSVEFREGDTLLGSATLDAAGVATFTTSSLSVGTHPVTAVYPGNDNFTAATSSAVSQVVIQAASITALASSLNPSAFESSVTFTATVTSAGDGIATGSVDFKDDGALLGSAVLDAAGKATFSSSSLAIGPHSITAVYAGSTQFLSSTSDAVSQVVDKAAAITALISSFNPSAVNQSITFTATVTSGAGIPTGSVTFKNGAAVLGTVALNATGVATFITAALPAGTHTISAEYGGSETLSPASGSLEQVVQLRLYLPTIYSVPGGSR